jgi:uncharacterized protein YaaR (DUF327 family)
MEDKMSTRVKSIVNANLELILKSSNILSRKNKILAAERIKAVIDTAFKDSSSNSETEKLKLAAKLAIEVVQDNVNHGNASKPILTGLILEKLGGNAKAIKLFDMLTQDNLVDLEITSVHRMRLFKDIMFSFQGVNYTHTNQELTKFVDQYHPRVDFISTMPLEINLEIIKKLTTKDQMNYRLVNPTAASLVDDKYNSSHPLASIKLSNRVIINKIKFDKFCEYLASSSCITRSLDLSQIGNAEGAFRGFSFEMLFSALRLNTSITSLNITGYKLSNDDLTLIGKLPNLQKVTMTEGMEDSEKIKVLKELTKAWSNNSEFTKKGLTTSLVKLILSSGLPDQYKFKLLLAKAPSKDPRSLKTLTNDYVEVVSEFIQAVLASNVSSKDKVEILLARKNAGDYGLFLALESGLVEAVSEFIQAVIASNLSIQDKARILAVKNENWRPGIFLALEFALTEAVSSFIQAVIASNLSTRDKVKLLSSKRLDEDPGLCLVLQTGYAKAVSEFVKVVLASNLPIQGKVELLFAKRTNEVPGLFTNEVPGLFLALQNGLTEAVSCFIKPVLASDLPIQDKIELLSAKKANGVPGLFLALQKGHAEAVSEFVKAVLASNLPTQGKVELVMAKKLDGSPGLVVALNKGSASVIFAYTALVLTSDLPHQDKVDILDARMADGTSGLSLALQNEHTEAALILIKQLIQLKMDLLMLNERMILASISPKLHGILIAIAKNNKFLQNLKSILSDSQKQELFQIIIKTQEPIIDSPPFIDEITVDILGYNSNEKLWNKMKVILGELKAEIEDPQIIT